MEVKTTSANGEHVAKQPVKVRNEFKILLVTDKPLYQPGQLIHLRALALQELTMKAVAGGELTFEVEDAKGNKVFKKREKLNDFGVASADFQLADEVNMGDYRISALLGQSKAERAVTVKKYVLPKFKPVVKTDKPWYLPKETVKATVQVDYFFGKPVSGGDVKVKASTFDVELKEFATVATKTDAKGAVEFEVKLPDSFVGQPLEKGNAHVQIEVAVTDTADHTETVTKSFTVANAPLVLGAIPESGKLVPGIENLVYVVATSPDGSPAEAEVTLKAGKTEVSGTTNASGFVALRWTPSAQDLAPSRERRGDAIIAVLISAKDKKGNVASRPLELSSEIGRDQMLVRLDKGIYRAGETVKLDCFGTFDAGRVFIDAVKGGQTMLTTAATLEKGRVEVKVPLPASLFGSLEFHVYKILGDGEIVRDTRVVYVHPPEDLQIAIAADKESYKPAETAKIDFAVTNRDGKGVAAALGVIVVDESVYALQDMQPGLEKVYFTLAKELQEPKYGIKIGSSIGGLIQEKEMEERKQQVAIVLLAPVTPAMRTWQANTMAMRMVQFEGKLQQIFGGLQQFIVAQKGMFWQVNSGSKKREFKADLLKQIETDAKVPADAFKDPWGKTVTMSELQAIDKVFSFEYWAKVMSAQNLEQLFRALSAWLVTHDVLEGDGFRRGVLEEMVKSGAIKEEQLKDYFGEPITLDRLAAEDNAFKPGNLEKLATSLRKQAIFDALVKRVNEAGGVTQDASTKGWSYEPGLLAALKVATTKPKGGEFTLDELARENGAFAASNLAKIGSVARRGSVYGAIVAKTGKDGWNKVAIFDKEWKYAAKLLDTLVAESFLTKAQASDIGGAPFDLDALAKADAQFAPQTLLSSLITGAVQKIANGVCSAIHSKQQTLPDDPVEVLVKGGTVKEEEIRDPWGTRLKLVDLKQGEQGSLGCGLLSGKKTILSAGPDKAFDTADDVRYSQAGAAGSYQPNMTGCLFHQHDGSVVYFSQHGDERREEQSQFGFSGFGGGSGPSGGSGKQNRGGRLASRALKEMEKKKDSLSKNSPAKRPSDSAGEDYDEAEEEGGMPAGIRVREYFPETLLWKPMMITDAQGKASLDVTMADSITTWRVTASASTAAGMLGSTAKGILVFQPFFVDIDFPVSLTQNDAISVPVAVYNYLKEPQTITLKVAKEDWFELRDDEVKKVDLKEGEVRAVYFRVKVTGLGPRKFTVHAWGKDEAARDAIRRTVEVMPDGKMFEVVLNDRLSATIEKSVEIPANAIPGSFKIFCKCYPGVFSQVIEGVEGMLGMPHG